MPVHHFMSAWHLYIHQPDSNPVHPNVKPGWKYITLVNTVSLRNIGPIGKMLKTTGRAWLIRTWLIQFHLIRSFFEIFARFLSFHVYNAWLNQTWLIQCSTNSKGIQLVFNSKWL